MNKISKTLAVGLGFSMLPALATAAVVTAGPGGFDDGYATTITYEDDDAIAKRGTSFQRNDPLNALGAPDGNNPGNSALNGGFFEIGLGSSVDLTFGTLFSTSTTLFEITFGNASNFPEAVQLAVGLGGSFIDVGGPISNAAAAGGVVVGIGSGTFDTVRLTDLTITSAAVGGFDIDSVRVSPIAAVPLPAGGLLLLTGLAGVAAFKRKKKHNG